MLNGGFRPARFRSDMGVPRTRSQPPRSHLAVLTALLIAVSLFASRSTTGQATQPPQSDPRLAAPDAQQPAPAAPPAGGEVQPPTAVPSTPAEVSPNSTIPGEEVSLDDTLTVESVTARKEEALAAAASDEDLTKRLTETFDLALDQVQRRDKQLIRAREFEKEVAGLEATVESLRQALEQAEKAPSKPVPAGNVSELELEKTRLEQRLAELKKQLTTLEAQTATRPNRRNELRQKLAKLEQEATDLQTESLAPTAVGESPLLSRARAIERLSRKQAITAEAPSRRAELAKLDSFDAAGVPSLQRDLLTRQVALVTEELQGVVKALEQKRAIAAQVTVSQARREEYKAHPCAPLPC